MKLVILDRDGVLNENRPDFVKTPEELVLLPGVGAAVARLNATGMQVMVATNQSCIGRGIISEAELNEVHEALQAGLAKEGGWLDRIFFSPDLPEQATDRRKPGPGMLLEAMEAAGAAPEETLMIGDQLRDMQAAHAAGTHRVLVRTGLGAKALEKGIPDDIAPVAVYDDLSAAVDAILNR